MIGCIWLQFFVRSVFYQSAALDSHHWCEEKDEFCSYSILWPLTGRRSNIKDLIGQKQNKKPLNRKCSHLEGSPSCLAIAHQTQRTPSYSIANLAVLRVRSWKGTVLMLAFSMKCSKPPIGSLKGSATWLDLERQLRWFVRDASFDSADQTGWLLHSDIRRFPCLIK